MTERYAEIIIGLNQPKVDRIFSYRIPEDLAPALQQGMVVEVPFGSGNRKTRGFVVGFTDSAGADPDKMKEIRRILMDEPAFTERQLAVARWMQSWYDAPLGACLSLWVPRQVTRKPRKKNQDPVETPDLSPKLRLNEEQEKAARPVDEMLDLHLHRTFLLHGITGSGKTELYLQWIDHTLALGRQAIVLVPEISLTPQLIDIFTQRFGSRVGVTHSRLTDAERAKLWREARRGAIDVVIGPRSALFTPFADPGLIILDEEHETTYKSEQSPRYHAAEVAEKMGQLWKIPVVLGSATPRVESFYKAEQGIYAYLQLTKRAVPGALLPETRIIDMREEMAAGNLSIFCTELKKAIHERLSRGEQTILFLNRKGYSTFVNCRSCGFVLKCPRCNLPYTWHKEIGRAHV